jgi:hypothetical protein
MNEASKVTKTPCEALGPSHDDRQRRADRFGWLKASAVISEASYFGSCSSSFQPAGWLCQFSAGRDGRIRSTGTRVFPGLPEAAPASDRGHWTMSDGVMRCFLLCLILMLSGCSEVAIDCGDENTTNLCKKIIDECRKYAGPGSDLSSNTALRALHLACLNENKYSPTCNSCKRK